MRRVFAVGMLVVTCLVPTLGRADDDAGATKPPDTDAAFCARTRKPRVESVQIVARRWVARVDAMRAACTVGWVKTGAMRVDGNRVYPETKGDVKCPKGPPAGETKESVWGVLSLFMPVDPVETDEVMTIGERAPDIDAANVRCVTEDGKLGLKLQPLVNDTAGLKRVLAWKP